MMEKERVRKYKCLINENEDMEMSDKEKYYSRIHFDPKMIIDYSSEVMERKNESFIKLPFCTTLEAECFGAIVKLGENTSRIRTDGYALQNTKDTEVAIDIDLGNERFQAMMSAVSSLCQENTVSFRLMGAISVISMLMDASDFYKLARKDKSRAMKIMKMIEDGIVEYALKAVSSGATIISYADPGASMDIVGPKFYKDVVGPSTMRIFSALKSNIPSAIVHVCPKASLSLEESGLLEVKPRKVDKKAYGQTIADLAKGSEVKFIGHRCIKSSGKLETDVIYNLHI